MSVTTVCTKRDIVLLRLNIIAFRVLGLAPFTIDITSGVRKNVMHITLNCSHSLIAMVYNIILCLVLLSIVILVVTELNKQSNSKFIFMEYIFELVFVIWGNACCVTVMLINCFRQKTSVMLANQYLNWEVGLMRMKLHNYSQEQFCFYTLMFMTHILVNMLTFIIDTSTVISTNVFLSLNVIPGFILGCSMIQYAIVLTSIKTRFNILNNSLKLLVVKPVTALHYDGILSWNIMPNDSIVEKFSAIKQTHRALIQIWFDFSSGYTWTIMFALSFIYVELIYCVYYFIAVLINSADSIYVIDMILWIVKDIFVIVALTGCAMATIAEMKRTRGIVYKVIDNCTTHIRLKYELQVFASELLEQKIPSIAFGMISLDGNLLQSMLNTVITYMIILVQYDQHARNAE